MASEHIGNYLNNHLAGSVAALELIEYLKDAHAGTPIERFLAELRAEVTADRGELETIMKQLDIAESRTRKASAWIAGKVTELRLHADDPAGGHLRLLESLEALSLGIEGKRSLWRALSVAAEKAPALRLADFERLMKRAEEQRGRVEEVRLEAARVALAVAS